MIPFFKKQNKEYPDFWLAYMATFDNPLPKDVSEVRFVVLDTETTGFDYTRDRILSIGALSLANGVIKVNESLELFLEQKEHNPATVKVHGILKDGPGTSIREETAIQELLNYLQNSPIVAHHAKFDIEMINRALKRMGLPKLKNVHVDTSNLYGRSLLKSNLIDKRDSYSLDELAEKFGVSMKDRHTALGDAYITAMVFMRLLRLLKRKEGGISLSSLLKK
ncbi:MAG: PolC-type DNA polymerase III [Flavobacteriaceae bacterium]